MSVQAKQRHSSCSWEPLARTLRDAYEREADVLVDVRVCELCDGKWERPQGALLLLPKRDTQSQCLGLDPDWILSLPRSYEVLLEQPISPQSLVQLVNGRLNLHRRLDGELNDLGRHLLLINDLQHRYRVSRGDKCLEIQEWPSQKEFLELYVQKGKPVVIKGGIKDWKASKEWYREYLREMVGEDSEIHVKLSPDGQFEGCDEASNWEEYEVREIPEHVREQLTFPDLVVVRPAYQDMSFGDFLDKVDNSTFSLYMEYASLRQYAPQLEDDLEKLSFADFLRERHLNIWIGDGNTIGKLHFDEFDNLLCQVRGKKEVMLFEPYENSNLYEGHIPEAMLEFDPVEETFIKRSLPESTSMVMSPVDPVNPDFDKFPLFQNAISITCTIITFVASAGEVSAIVIKQNTTGAII